MRDVLSVSIILLYFFLLLLVAFTAHPSQPLMRSLSWWTIIRLLILLLVGTVLFPLTLRNVEASISRRRWEHGEHYVWLLIAQLRRHGA